MNKKIRAISLPVIFALCSCQTAKKSEKALYLPAEAKVTITGTGRDAHDTGAEACADFSINESEVRNIFNTYRKLNTKELHDMYLWAPCFVQGTVQLKGKSYYWRARPGHTLETDYPNEVEIEMGGEPTDDPSGK